MSRKPRVILHIGHAKTATTFLQYSFIKNRAKLRGRGLFVPTPTTSRFKHDMEKLVDAGKPFAGNAQPIFAELRAGRPFPTAKLVERAEERDIFLSHEPAFYFPDIITALTAQFRELGYVVEIYAYLLRYDQVLVGSYAQNTRNHRFSGSLRDFITVSDWGKRFHFHHWLGRLALEAQPDSISARIFDKRLLKDNDVLSDFIDWTGMNGVTIADFSATLPPANPSLPLERLEFLRMVNQSADDKLLNALRGDPVQDGEIVGSQRFFNFHFNKQIRELVIRTYAADRKIMLETLLADESEEARSYWQETAPVPEEPEVLDLGQIRAIAQRYLGQST